MCCNDIKILPLCRVSSFPGTNEDCFLIGSMMDVMVGSTVDSMVDFTVISNTGSLFFAVINCHIYYYNKRYMN